MDTIDITGAELIKRICDDVNSNGETFMFSSLLSGAGSREKLMLYLKDLGVMESVGKENIFPDVDRALEAAENRMIEKYDKDVRFTSLGPGLYFGEMALLERSVRSARAVADQDCELYVL